MENLSRNTTNCLYQDGYIYKKKSTYKGIDTYVCTDTTWVCKSKGKLIDGIINITKNHNHAPDTDSPNYQQCETFKDNLWMEIVTTEDELRIIWDRIALLHPEPASIISFASIERQMRRWRQQNRPPEPTTLRHYDQLFNSDQWQKYRVYNQGQLHAHTIELNNVNNVNNNFSVTVFCDRELLATLTDVTELYIDATFKVCPRSVGITQLLTIMGRIDNTPTPLAWALMTRKTTAAYTAVLNYFRDQLAPHIQPTTVHIDYEIAMRNSILSTYPNVTIVNCYFHYCQALLRRLKSKGKPWMTRLSRSDIYLAFYRKLLGLAFLPAADIQTAFDWLLLNSAPDTLNFFGNDFFAYYRNNWLNQTERFSVFNARDRTNNFIEAYHRILTIRFGVHPGIWVFTAKLKNFQEIIRIEILSLNRGIPIRRTIRQEYVNRDQVINRMWELYTNRILTIPRFLSCVNHVSASFDNDLLINDPDAVNEFVNFQVHNRNIQPPYFENDVINMPGELNYQLPVPVTRRNVNEENNLQIYILESIGLSLCSQCNYSILNVVSLPCNHWFGCIACATAHASQSFNAHVELVCQVCNSVIILFRTVQVS